MELGGERAGLLDAVDDGPADPHARIIADLLEVDAAQVSIIGHRRQHLLGRHGLAGALGERRRTPLEQSLDRVVADRDALLRVEDMAADPSLREHPARTGLGVEAYLGVPLRAPSSEVVGAVAAIHRAPRPWTDEDLTQLQAMRDLVQVELRRLLRSRQHRARAEEVALLLSTLRHELGGELAIVLGGIETAMLPGIDDDLRNQVLANARRDCRRVVSTLDALLRVDSRAPVQLREVRLEELVTEVINSTANGTANGHDTSRIALDIADCRLVTEAVLLGHIVRNLLDNARKYSEGPIQVTARCGEGTARITVADEGPGIPEHVVSQLYEPFSRARTDGGASGFGLGLYIIRNLCQRLGGTLSVDTDEHGTAITITVPDQDQSPTTSVVSGSDRI